MNPARYEKLNLLADFLTKAEDGSRIIGFSRNGALKNLHKAMHLARIALDPSGTIEKMKAAISEKPDVIIEHRTLAPELITRYPVIEKEKSERGE